MGEITLASLMYTNYKDFKQRNINILKEKKTTTTTTKTPFSIMYKSCKLIHKKH